MNIENLDNESLKLHILELVREYSRRTHAANLPGYDPRRPVFKPGVDTIPYAGRVFDESEVSEAVSSALDFWLTLGSQGEAFERELATFLGVRKSILVNSGSSANLIAVSTLTSPKIPTDRRLLPGDEVITAAAGFPTTVAPIIQCGAVPVFIDVNPLTANADCSHLEAAYRPGKTKAVMLAHALGNPFDIFAVLRFCRKYNLWLIEDNCDALGSTYSMPLDEASGLGLEHLISRAKLREAEPDGSMLYPRIVDGKLEALTGSFGDLSTQSFYPPHHLTMGEGGAVNIVRSAFLKPIAESFRDWGRDCWCPSGMDNTCNKRFGWQLGELPSGYDHKYIYSHLGYNLKPLDLQAAIGRVQLRRISDFVNARRENWDYFRESLAKHHDCIDFQVPTHSIDNQVGSGEKCDTKCSWFGFMILVKPNAPFTRTEMSSALERVKIGTRMMFGGNLVRQPAFVSLKANDVNAYRIIGDLKGSDYIMDNALFIGIYPGLTKAMCEYVVDAVTVFITQYKKDID
jgi:CDP-6-deoxy-D-xylo-4-hexulose-3-dehydrase